ncbi:U3 small nucleolar RNA-associated protein [Pseudocyphellaria aurata]|nr:U3 small nucleolar RNA-associated protein [Pseudocyphellaria aurata]
MDIHRCRFVPYPRFAINALAFSHPSSLNATSKEYSTLRLAIGRANGDIEIWNPLNGIWLQEMVLHGGKDRSIEGLVWTQDPDDVDRQGRKTPGKLRLFSIGYSTAVTEWDLALGKPLRHSAGNFGELWCIAAQPGLPSSEKASTERQDHTREPNLVAGCADGAIVVFSTSDGDLRFLKALARPSKKRARVLSITYQNRDTVVVGHADSTIRVFDARNGQQIRNMSLGAGPVGGPKETLVWSVKCLPDGTIVSGDSTGTLRFWDGKTYTLLQRIKSHVADILDVTASADGETVISGGMDRRTTVYKRMGRGKKGGKRQWAELMHRRYHKHDVKAMATFETKSLSVLVSGGLDTNPIIVPIQKFGKEFHRTISGLPLQPCMGGAPGERLMMSWWAEEIHIWRIAGYDQSQRQVSQKGNELDPVQTRKLAASVVIQGEESLTSADLAANGRMLAACSVSRVKLFRLRPRPRDTLKVLKVEIPSEVGEVGARMVKFSPDGKWLLIIRANSSTQVCRLREDGSIKKRLFIASKIINLKRLSRDPITTKVQCGSLGSYERSINRAAFSADSRVLVVGDLSGYLDSWVLEGHEDLTRDADENVEVTEPSSSDDEDADEEIHHQVILGQHWIRNPTASLIPKLSGSALILSFRPAKEQSTKAINGNTAVHPARKTSRPRSQDLPHGEDRLLAITCGHQMYEFNVLSGGLSKWSRRNPSPSLPRNFRNLKDRAMGLIWDICGRRERIWLYGSSWLWMLDLSVGFPIVKGPGKHGVDRNAPPRLDGGNHLKRRRESDESDVEGGKGNTGAGDQIPRSELSMGIGRKFRKMEGPKTSNSPWISADRELVRASDDDDDDYETANPSALLDLRRGPDGNIITDRSAEDPVAPRGSTTLARRRMRHPRSSWGTHVYRDILGIVPLGDDAEHRDGHVGRTLSRDDIPRGVEVALVERPLWEADLPPRYHGNQEWDD